MKKTALTIFLVLILNACAHHLYKRMVVVKSPTGADVDRDVEYCTQQSKTSAGEEVSRQLVLLFIPLQTSFNNRIDRRYKTCMENLGYVIVRKPPGYGFNE